MRLVTVACLSVLSSSLLAQERGALSGRVIERLGRPVAQASVRLARGDSSLQGQLTTDANGAWSIGDLVAGSYRLTIRRLGFRALQVDTLVEANRTTVLLLQLDPAPLTLDTLVVQSSTTPAPTSDVGTSLHAAEIALLPTTLDIRQLIALTPGRLLARWNHGHACRPRWRTAVAESHVGRDTRRAGSRRGCRCAGRAGRRRRDDDTVGPQHPGRRTADLLRIASIERLESDSGRDRERAGSAVGAGRPDSRPTRP
ncbi:MAG: hypothetical protein DMD62_12625 [Gemmatimonadetes bacterium]|nr:MAG: hypothetical protein DMD62_12625 [Gemmatimonadota bacterium]